MQSANASRVREYRDDGPAARGDITRDVRPPPCYPESRVLGPRNVKPRAGVGSAMARSATPARSGTAMDRAGDLDRTLHENTEMPDVATNPEDARAILREAADAATSARRAVRHVLEALEAIIALRASAGRAQDSDRMRELADDLRAARRAANISLRAVQRTADGALYVLGGESPHDRARTRARDRAEQMGKDGSNHRPIGRVSRPRTDARARSSRVEPGAHPGRGAFHERPGRDGDVGHHREARR